MKAATTAPIDFQRPPSEQGFCREAEGVGDRPLANTQYCSALPETIRRQPGQRLELVAVQQQDVYRWCSKHKGFSRRSRHSRLVLLGRLFLTLGFLAAAVLPAALSSLRR